MKAIILAAGRGSRMKAMTESRPKCLLKLGGKTLLEWQTQALRGAGIDSIAIVRGYRGNDLQLPDYSYFDNPRWAETNMVSSLISAKSVLENETCLISYSDIVYHPSIVASLIRSSAPIAISYDEHWESLWRQRFENPLDDAESFAACEGKLQSIGEKTASLSRIQGQYMGLLRLQPKGWKQIEEFLSPLPSTTIDKMDMTSLLKQLLQKNISIEAIPVQGRWCEVDREEDLRLYNEKLKQLEPWSHDWRS